MSTQPNAQTPAKESREVTAARRAIGKLTESNLNLRAEINELERLVQRNNSLIEQHEQIIKLYQANEQA